MPTETLTPSGETIMDRAGRIDDPKPLPSFAIRNLGVLQYANGFTLWHYKAETIANLLSPNFFADCSDMMAAGDHMHVSAPDGNWLLAVEHSDAGNVSVRKMLG